VRVREDIDARIAGHDGVSYTSPPQTHAAALMLTSLLVGTAMPAETDDQAWTVAVAGGRRSVEIVPA
jgi:hypothetical protein